MIYQSCTNLFQLNNWLNTKYEKFDDSVPIYNKNIYGSSNILSVEQMLRFMDLLELHCTRFPMKALIEHISLAVYNLNGTDYDNKRQVKMMSVEHFDDNNWYKVT